MQRPLSDGQARSAHVFRRHRNIGDGISDIVLK